MVRQLHDEVVRPVAVEATRGAWFRGWRLVSIDGSTLDVADEKGNSEAFGRPGSSRGTSAYPQIRFVSLVENGTHVLFGSRMADYATSETALAKTVLPSLSKGMLCLADRGFFGFEMWKQAVAAGADLLWRVKKNILLPCEKRLPDGSYLSRIYASQQDQRRGRNGVVVRVVEYRLEGVEGAEPLYRLATTIPDHQRRQPRNWRRSITTAGRSKPHLTNSRLICGAPASSCAARHRIWYSRSSMAF